MHSGRSWALISAPFSGCLGASNVICAAVETCATSLDTNTQGDEYLIRSRMDHFVGCEIRQYTEIPSRLAEREINLQPFLHCTQMKSSLFSMQSSTLKQRCSSMSRGWGQVQITHHLESLDKGR